MPYFTSPIDPKNGLILNVHLGVSAAFQQTLNKNNLPIPRPIAVKGILDTGASCTCIDPSIISSLALIPTGHDAMLTPSTGANAVEVDVYDVSVAIFSTYQEAPCWIPNLPVVESSLANQGFQVLIGRDVLSRCLLFYDGKRGVYTLSF